MDLIRRGIPSDWLAPAPRLGSDELAAEMAELYAMALLRDVPFEDLRRNEERAAEISAALAAMPWFDPSLTPEEAGGAPISRAAVRRRRRTDDGLIPPSLFRDCLNGCTVGPYLSQFLVQGTADDGVALLRRRDGVVRSGAHRVDQRVEAAHAGTDYMRRWEEWLDVQEGADTSAILVRDKKSRFIVTPRDLAAFSRRASRF